MAKQVTICLKDGTVVTGEVQSEDFDGTYFECTDDEDQYFTIAIDDDEDEHEI